MQAGDFNVSRSLLQNGEYDWPQITWLKQVLHAQSRVVFAGAHIGAVLYYLVAIKENLIAPMLHGAKTLPATHAGEGGDGANGVKAAVIFAACAAAVWWVVNRH